jgi:threonine/homoserine/homoserine lactone efflux protein
MITAVIDGVPAFLGVSGLVIATPGQDTVLTVRNTLSGGRRAGVFTAVGVSSGQAIWALATSTGVTALLVAWDPARVALKIAGAAYLFFLGARGIYKALRSRSWTAVGEADPVVRPTPLTALGQGILSNLMNPKMGGFFTSLLPQFATSFSGLLGLGLVFSSLTLVWLTAYSFAVTAAASVLRSPRIRQMIEIVTGAVLVGLGAWLAVQSS